MQIPNNTPLDFESNLMSILSNFSSAKLFEAQARVPSQRMCGAAALVMAYRRFGLQVDQHEVWQKVAHQHEGCFRAHTYHLAQDAIRRGLFAAIIQTHRPWQLLSACWRNNIAAVLNHRLSQDSHEGHYSLLAGLSGQRLKLHDPLLGPSVDFEREQFQKLWLPAGANCEIAGNILLAISDPAHEPSVLAHCNRALRDSVECERCQMPVCLKPAMALGCFNTKCSQRLWLRLFCPNCDHAIQTIE